MWRSKVTNSIAAALLLSFALLSGCSSGPQGPEPPSNRQMSSAVEKSGGISVTLRSVPAVGPPGSTFSLTLDIRNLSGKPAEFKLSSGQMYEFAAFGNGGDEVWRWSEGMRFTQAISPITFAPGESMVFKVAWASASAPAGLYSIQGYFMGLPDVRPTVSVEIEPD